MTIPVFAHTRCLKLARIARESVNIYFDFSWAMQKLNRCFDYLLLRLLQFFLGGKRKHKVTPSLMSMEGYTIKPMWTNIKTIMSRNMLSQSMARTNPLHEQSVVEIATQIKHVPIAIMQMTMLLILMLQICDMRERKWKHNDMHLMRTGMGMKTKDAQ